MNIRALHYVLKVGNRKAAYEFFTDVLRMKPLRHEEYKEGCKASCNGPYKGKWSKTMIGYGKEDDHFVFELTYNYEICSYRLGNELRGITIESDDLYKAIEGRDDSKKLECGTLQIHDPDGHCFFICPGKGTKVVKVGLRVQDLKRSLDFWTNHLGMKVVDEKEEGKRVAMSYGEGQCRLELCQLPNGTSLDRGSGPGRIAFAYPEDKLEALQSKIKAANLKVEKELTTLETPGKASVRVIILLDPDNHEICFVGDKNFHELCKPEPNADESIRKAIEDDDSDKQEKKRV